jgi:hypothetical protein
VQEIVSLYNDQKTDVYCTLLDASKAFDRLEFCTLFKKLIKRNMCPLFTRILLFMYVNQSLVVRWNGSMSDRFQVTNGVKQGGITSPLLFCIYINDLLDILKNNGIGCYIGPEFYGALGYADDIILMCPSVQGTKEMLLTCEEYANNHKIKFNVTKSQIIAFTHNKNVERNPVLYLNNEQIPVVNHVKHLGHILYGNMAGIVDVDHIGGSFSKCVNIMMANIGSVSSCILGKLFISYCCNFYGITLCNVRSLAFTRLFVLWRKAVRRIFKLPRRSHNLLLPYILDRPSFDLDIHSRVCKFYTSLLESPNLLVQNLAIRCQQQSISNMGKNVSLFYVKYKIDINDYMMSNVSYLKQCIYNTVANDHNDELKATGELCNELVNIRDGLMFSPLTYNECKDLIDQICTDDHG